MTNVIQLLLTFPQAMKLRQMLKCDVIFTQSSFGIGLGFQCPKYNSAFETALRTVKRLHDPLPKRRIKRAIELSHFVMNDESAVKFVLWPSLRIPPESTLTARYYWSQKIPLFFCKEHIKWSAGAFRLMPTLELLVSLFRISLKIRDLTWVNLINS